MNIEPRSIADHIDCLARLTSAPQSFVIQVKDLFSRKGISLESDAKPYIAALEEAFRREENIRSSARHARQDIACLHESFNKIGRRYVRQLEQKRRGGNRVREQRKRRSAAGGQIAIPGDHRSIVTRQQRDDLPMVPGPKEKQ
jgi:hypothetical protein